MQFSLDLLRSEGWAPLIVEVHGKYGRTHDLLGIGDILCAPAFGRSELYGQTRLVQTTTWSNRLARVRKIQEAPKFGWAKRAGWQVHVHGWRDNDDASKGVEIIDMANMDVILDTVQRQVGKRRGVPRKQAELHLGLVSREEYLRRRS